MKVLLVADVKKVGWLGDIVEVSEGYARNYLLPKGIGVIPTESRLRALAKEKAKHAEQRIQDKKRFAETAAAVEGAEVVIAAKANEQGHLFGSVGSSEIAANLREQGFEVADDVVQLHGHIKEVGKYTVKLEFIEDVTASVNVVVVAEQSDENKPAADDVSQR